MTDAMEPGLRERKRLATRRAIQSAAVHVALERGLEGATIEEIARVADVSPRTFFNYFATKEEAVLGDGPAIGDGAAVDAFVRGAGPLLGDLAELVAASIPSALSDPELVQPRRQLAQRHPELTARRMARLHDFELELTDIVERRLEVERPDDDPGERHARARLIGLVALAAMRHGWGNWVERGGGAGALADEIRASFAALPELARSTGTPRVG